MPHSPVESYRRSGRDVGENLIAETSACPLTTRAPLTLEGWRRDKGRLPLPIIIPNHPLDKIFGDMTARLTEFTHASVRRYNLTKFYREGKMLKISAILLGAGESKRMGVDKLSLPWGRKAILERCFKILLQSEVRELIVVLGVRHEGMRNLFQGRKVKIVINPHAQRGMSASIQRGLQAIHPGCHGILIALGDQPFLKTRTINALIRAFRQGRSGIVVPSFRGRRGHPVIFHQKYKRELLNLKGDVGGRSIIERHPEDIRVVHLKSEGVVKDVDTWQDYRRELRMKS